MIRVLPLLIPFCNFLGWLLFAAAGVALTAWILTPEDPYAAALAS